ncbi:MAG: hypothetical protein KF837_20640 [Labilithrix sp.]|nr:hypothetical protein [Labilithrix sp.]
MNVPVADESSITADDDGPFDPKTGDEIAELFARVMRSRPPPVKRAVFLKPHACATAKFDISADLPERLKVGLFATPGTHDAWVRISSDTSPATPDKANSTVGFSLKVLGVPGTKILAGEEDAQTHDFLTQNHDVFFVDTAQDFLEFTRAIFDRTLDQYLAAHPTFDQILKDMEKPVENALATRYWSTQPYRFGDKDYVKYAVRPCSAWPPEPPAEDEPSYIRARVERDLAASDACFDLQVQLRGDDANAFPLDKATVRWDESVSAPQTVARITIAKQDVAANEAACENMSFTAWHALPEHRPVGSINKARGIAYKKLADERRTKNNVPIREPQP